MGAPKALLPLNGRTFLECILQSIARSRIDRTVVVVGHHRAAIESALQLSNTVYNPDYEHGMGTSVQAGIRALPPQVLAAVIFLVDHPVVDPSTIESLLDALPPGRIAIPTYGGRRGHPAAFSREVFPEILALGFDKGLNAVVRRDPARVTEVPVDDPGVLWDVDTPEQFEKLLRESR